MILQEVVAITASAWPDNDSGKAQAIQTILEYAQI